MPWEACLALMVKYSGYEMYGKKGRYYPNRIKQWFNYLKRQYPEAETMFMDIRRLKDAEAIVKVLSQ